MAVIQRGRQAGRRGRERRRQGQDRGGRGRDREGGRGRASESVTAE